MPKGIKGFQKGHTLRLGIKHTEKTKIKMSKSQTGHPSYPQAGFQKGHTIQLGEKHWAWKGDKVGRTALHDWVKRRLGFPRECKHCGTTKAKKFEWANISHEYKRDLTDWMRLCVSCHRKYDGHQQKMWATRRLKNKVK